MRHRIGVSGDIGSFSEQAGIAYIKKHNILDYELLHLINMELVLNALNLNLIDIGIFPVNNKNRGLVEDAFTAMGKYKFNFMESFELNIEQCLIAKVELDLSQIKLVYSYAPAFKQCDGFINSKLSHVKLVDYGDMAKAMRDLANGTLNGSDVAVIGPQLAAEKFGLKIILSGIEDFKPNLTNFIVVSRFIE